MIGALPRSLFGLSHAMDQPAVVADPAPAPFTWGAAGSRMTPEMLAQRGKMAQGLIAAGMDTSPVGSWTQGLARVAQALVGNMQQNRLDKAAATNAGADRQILAALTGGQGGDAASLAALSDPYVSDGVKDAVKLNWQATHKTPAQPSEFERALIASGVQPGTPQWTAANAARVTNYTDPTVNIPLPGGRIYVGPRSGIAAATGGGDPASVAPGGASPPATLPPDFDFDKGGPTRTASAGFR